MPNNLAKHSEVDLLVDFIENKMRMSHIYQPLLIRLLVESGGSSTIRDLALRFVTFDEAELKAMEGILKKMPVPVLKRRGFVDKQGDLVSLLVKVKDLKDKATILRACENRLSDYLEKKGENVWSYKWISNPVRNSIRYKVLADGGNRCALCGISANERPSDVDHIIPSSMGGSSSYENLQVLCSKCNRAKGNTDNKDFREVATPEQRESLKTMHSTLLKGSIPSTLVWTKANTTKQDVLAKFNNDFEEMRKHYKQVTGSSFRGKSIDTLAERIANAS